MSVAAVFCSVLLLIRARLSCTRIYKVEEHPTGRGPLSSCLSVDLWSVIDVASVAWFPLLCMAGTDVLIGKWLTCVLQTSCCEKIAVYIVKQVQAALPQQRPAGKQLRYSGCMRLPWVWPGCFWLKAAIELSLAHISLEDKLSHDRQSWLTLAAWMHGSGLML